MSNEEERKKIELFSVERPCDAKFDTSQLALQDLKQVDSHYSRRLMMLQDADIQVSWSLEDVKKYFWQFLSGEQKEIFTPQNARTVTYSLGLLFQYRMDWERKGYGLGELLNSISLLPNEELTLEFKTWETSSMQQDTSTDLEEKNASDIQTTQSDAKEVMDDYQSQEKFELGVHAEVNYGFVSASADTKYATDSSEQHKTVAKTAREGTRKSANSLSQKRSVKVAISRETGSESRSTRKIKNINQCRTLNINYYQLLKQYLVSMYLYNVEIVLFGNSHFTSGQNMVIGTILPITVAETASVDEHIASLLDYSLDSNPYRFQATILKHCVPRPDINIPDLYGVRRYAFAINPGPWEDRDHDGVAETPSGLAELLKYLYGLYSKNSPPLEMRHMKVLLEKPTSLEAATVSAIVVPTFHFLQGVKATQFTQKVKTVQEMIVDQYVETRKELTPEQLVDSWPVQVPTYGVYAETMLGQCSGCEDYFEIQRQLDLEMKQIEIEKLKLEVEKLKILNQKIQAAPPGSQVTIKNPPQNAALRLNVDVAPSGDSANVSFEEAGG